MNVEGDFFHGHGYVFSPAKNTFVLVDVPGAMATFWGIIADDGTIGGTYVNSDL